MLPSGVMESSVAVAVDPKWYHKRRTTSWICIAYALTIGMEYSSVMTSLFFYLREDVKVEHQKMWYGIVMCVTGLSGAFNGVLAGKLFDKTRRLKATMIIFTLFTLVGNIMYTFHSSVWFLVCGRFLSGLCDAAQPVISGKY